MRASARLRRLAAVQEAATEAGVSPPDLLYLVSLTDPTLLTPDMVGRAVAWRPPTTSYPAAPPLERPSDETWILLEEWMERWSDPSDPEALVHLAWIYGAGTMEPPDLWAAAHPSDLRQARNEVVQGARTAADLLGLDALTVERLAARIQVWMEAAPPGLPWEQALTAARQALLLGAMPRALRLMLDATSDGGGEREVEVAELARRFGLLDLSELLLKMGPKTSRCTLVQARLRLCLGESPCCPALGSPLGLQLTAALDLPLADADRALVALRDAPGEWSVEDQWLFASAAAWLAGRGLAGEAWGRARRDVARWRTDDPVLSALWARLAKRRRPTPEDLRDWMDRCPV